jgi:glutathione S-transferase
MIMGSRDFLVSDRPTIADIMLYSMLEYLRPVYDRFMPAHLRNLTAWYKRFGAIFPLQPYEVPAGYIAGMSGNTITERS